jgi:phospholipid/cholesterol/gamma-HCH transport system permease protein
LRRITTAGRSQVDTTQNPPQLTARWEKPDTLVLALTGDWRTDATLPGLETVHNELTKPDSKGKKLEFETTGLTGWGSRFVTLAARCHELCEKSGVIFITDTLPEGVRRLIAMSEEVPEKKDAARENATPSFLQGLGEGGMRAWAGATVMLEFLGEQVIALGNLFRGRAQFRWSDAWLAMQECGPQALGIVALINFLVGLIIAFVGAVGLEQFGATIYVADMVAVGTTREMGCIMTGIILCGRTGAAFAAQLGTMKVNEEINAFKTFGISPMEFLVLPRMIALVLMMPLLCVFADLIGMFGGFVVSTLMLHISPMQYIQRSMDAVQLKSFLLGIGKGSFFGFIVAYTGCLRGMQCGSNAAAVGEATTKAVVTGIAAIIASDGIFAVICNALHI